LTACFSPCISRGADFCSEDYFAGLSGWLNVVLALMTVLFFSHIVACLWHFVGEDEVNSRNETVRGWIYQEWYAADHRLITYLARCLSRSTRYSCNAWHRDRGEDALVSHKREGLGFFGSDKDRVSLEERYLTSFYWAVTTLTSVGYGDISPNTMSVSSSAAA